MGLTLDDAKKLCKDFSPHVVDGKTRCSFLQPDHEMCYRPDHFRCEIKIHTERQRLEAAGIQPYSVSRVGTFQACPRLYFLTYIAKAVVPTRQEWKALGTQFSLCTAKMDAGLPYEVIQDDGASPEAWMKLLASLECYKKAVEQGLVVKADKSEVFVEWKLAEGIHYRGYLDGVCEDGTVIIEKKYAAMAYDKLKISRQASGYFLGLPKAKKLVLQVCKKTRHKMGAKETPDTFLARLNGLYTPDENFDKQEFLRDDFDIESESMWMTLLPRQIEDAKKTRMWPPNFSSCEDFGGCGFKSYCMSHKTLGCGKDDCTHKGICGRVMPHMGF